MARGFRRKGHGAQVRYTARLDNAERGVVVGLMEQVRDLLLPVRATDHPGPGDPQTGDEFDRIVSGLGAIGLGVSVAADDQDTGGARPGPGEGGRPERDPALDRLLPRGSRTDDEVAAEFRAMTEQSLVTRKIATLDTAIAALSGSPDKVALAAPEALAVVIALTDVRLVLAERLDITTDEDAELVHLAVATAEPEDPRVQAAMVYDFLTWLQETLAEALAR